MSTTETRTPSPSRAGTDAPPVATERDAIVMTPIGAVHRDDVGPFLAIAEPFRAGLAGLGDFSHVHVHWWAERHDLPELRRLLTVPLPYADGREVGVFGCRAPVRPNLLMSTVCEIREVDEAAGTVRLAAVDAFEGTPVLDLKPYYGLTDRVADVRHPGYLAGWPTWFPEEGITLMPGEE